MVSLVYLSCLKKKKENLLEFVRPWPWNVLGVAGEIIFGHSFILLLAVRGKLNTQKIDSWFWLSWRYEMFLCGLDGGEYWPSNLFVCCLFSRLNGALCYIYVIYLGFTEIGRIIQWLAFYFKAKSFFFFFFLYGHSIPEPLVFFNLLSNYTRTCHMPLASFLIKANTFFTVQHKSFVWLHIG